MKEIKHPLTITEQEVNSPNIFLGGVPLGYIPPYSGSFCCNGGSPIRLNTQDVIYGLPGKRTLYIDCPYNPTTLALPVDENGLAKGQLSDGTQIEINLGPVWTYQKISNLDLPLDK